MPRASGDAQASAHARSSKLSPATRTSLLIALVGVAAYGLALVATLPARIVLPSARDATGTVWHGDAAIAGGNVAAWHWSPLKSLARLGFAVDWTIEGPGTELSGEAVWRGPGQHELLAVAGRAGWPLVAAIAPALPFACDVPLRVALDRVAGDHIAGTVQVPAGTCAVAGLARTMPRLIATADGVHGSVTTWTDRASHLADFTVTSGRVRVHVAAAGRALVPIGPGDLSLAF